MKFMPYYTKVCKQAVILGSAGKSTELCKYYMNIKDVHKGTKSIDWENGIRKWAVVGDDVQGKTDDKNMITVEGEVFTVSYNK